MSAWTPREVLNVARAACRAAKRSGQEFNIDYDALSSRLGLTNEQIERVKARAAQVAELERKIDALIETA